ncbi:MAG: transcriptional repressor [Bacteroidia bacterium]|nr:MAG: transcriptional repressor [Bacteroidia bacterium]
MNSAEAIEKLKQKGLRVTPQRVAVFRTVYKLNNHPTAENIISTIQKNLPHIAVGTVYKVLDTLVGSNLLEKVKTERGTMRYDPVLSKHHHLYCKATDRIEDYEDSELDKMIESYFSRKEIEHFTITDIQLQINGKFKFKKHGKQKKREMPGDARG